MDKLVLLNLYKYVEDVVFNVQRTMILSCRFSVDDDYLQNASAILDKLKTFYRQGEESSNLSKLLQDYTQVLNGLLNVSQYLMMWLYVHIIGKLLKLQTVKVWFISDKEPVCLIKKKAFWKSV